MITDSNGNPLAGVTVTSVSAKAAAKDAGTIHVTTVADGHFTLANVPVTNVVNNNGSTVGGAVTISIVPPSGYLGATAQVFPQAQVTSSEAGSGVQGGDTNPQVIWFDNFNADAGTIRLPALNSTITGILRDADTGAPISNFPLRLTFEHASFDQFGANFCSPQDAPVDPSEGCFAGEGSTVVSYASGSTATTSTESSGASTVAGRFFFNNVPADSCVRIYAPGLNFSDPTGNSGQDFAGAVCDDGDEASSVSYITISTNDDFVQLNRVFATSSNTNDTIAPFVVAVGNVTDTGGTCGGQQFGSGSFGSAQGNTITVTFSEPVNINTALLGATGSNPITILIGNPPNITTAQVTAVAAGSDGRSLVLTLANPLPAGSQVLVQIPVEGVTDLAGNPLTTGPLSFDGVVQNVNNGSVENEVLDLCFNTFSPNTTPGQIAVTQVNNQIVNASTLLYQSSHALADFVQTDAPDHGTVDQNGNPVGIPSFAGIEQLNGPDQLPVPSPTAPDPSDELTALATALSGLGAPTASTTVVNEVARVHVTNPNASTIVIALQDPTNLRAKDVGFWLINTGSGDPQIVGVICPPAPAACPNPKALPLQISNGGSHWYVINPNGATDFDVVIAGASLGPSGELPGDPFTEDVSNGDIVHVIARDSNRVLISTADTPVVDNVVPSTVLQLLGQANGVVNLNEFGEGGTVVITSSTNTGIPVLPITPQIADKIDPGHNCSGGAGGANGTVTGYSSDNYYDETYLPSGLHAQQIPNGATVDTSGQCRADTDATGMAVFLGPNGASRNDVTAIAVSEEVALNGTTAGTPAYTPSGTATLGPISVHNHTPTEDFVAGTSGNLRDLVEFNVDNVFALQADARRASPSNQIISLSGLIKDTTAGNVADDTAHVLLKDKFPPMITQAFYDGTNIVVTFNEPVQLAGHLVFDGCNAVVDLGYTSANPATHQVSIDATGTVVTVPVDNFVEQTAGTQPGTCFNNTSPFLYAESQYTKANLGTLTALSTTATPQRHGYVTASDVPDAAGNIWDCALNAAGNCVAPLPAFSFDWATVHLGIGAPRFAIADILGPFVPNNVKRGTNFSTGANQGQPGQTVNITIGFSQPIQLGIATTAGNCGTRTLDAFGDSADADCSGTLTNAELLTWAGLKFQYFDSTANANLAPSGVQILDSTGTDILVAGGNPNDARTVILTFTLVNAVASGDRVRIISGEGVTSALDATQSVYPFDQGVGGAPNSEPGQTVGDGVNDINELFPIPPDTTYTCPQTTLPDGGTTQC